MALAQDDVAEGDCTEGPACKKGRDLALPDAQRDLNGATNAPVRATKGQSQHGEDRAYERTRCRPKEPKALECLLVGMRGLTFEPSWHRR
jgi:hypothetical protein